MTRTFFTSLIVSGLVFTVAAGPAFASTGSTFVIQTLASPQAKTAEAPKMGFDFQIKKGDLAHFKSTAALTLNGMAINMTNNEVQTIKEVPANGGHFVTQIDDTDIQMISAGNALPAPTSDSVVITAKPSGEIVLIKSDQVSPSAYRLANLTSFFHPTEGTSSDWTINIPANKETGAVALTAHYKVIEEVKVNGFDAYKISFELKETSGDTPASATGTMWVDKKTGWMDKMEGNLENAPLPGSPGTLSAKVTTERVS